MDFPAGTHAKKISGNKLTVEDVLTKSGVFEINDKVRLLEGNSLSLSEDAAQKYFSKGYDYQEAGRAVEAAVSYAKAVVPLIAAQSTIDVSKELEAEQKKFAKDAHSAGVSSVTDFAEMLKSNIAQSLQSRGRAGG